MECLKDYEILLGTYEAFVLGYKLSEDRKPKLETSIADHAHAGSIRCITAADKFLITSGGDEIVKIFNLRNRSEHGTLGHQDGMINAMKFYDKKNLITCGEDGKICILRTGSWKVEKTLLSHTMGVIDIAVHPSGKLALTIGKDRKLVTWNLIKGRKAFVTNIKEVADFVRWSPDGQRYLVGFYKHVDVYSMADASIEFSVKLNGRSNDVAFLDDTTFALAGEMPHIEIYSLVTKELLHKFEAHETRVRCLAFIQPSCLVSGSNDGLIKVWKVTRDGDTFDIIQDGSADTKCRITSMQVHKVPKVAATVIDVKPEDVEAVAKAMAGKTKRKIGFAENSDNSDNKSSPVKETDANQQKVIVELDSEAPTPKKKKFKKKKKNGGFNAISK